MDPAKRSTSGVTLALNRQSRDVNIATYDSDSLHLKFKQKEGKLFAERVWTTNKPTIQYPLNRSVFQIEGIPSNLSSI
jgi:hypothetical protein